MTTKILMTASAVLLFALGIHLSFLPQETLRFFGGEPLPLLVLLVQTAGALYLGFGILNWTARGVLLGGIYSRPVAMGNFLHFAVVSVALLKALMNGQRSPVVLIGAVVYLLFAGWFGYVLFTPARKP
jgi:hypothetical protein